MEEKVFCIDCKHVSFANGNSFEERAKNARCLRITEDDIDKKPIVLNSRISHMIPTVEAISTKITATWCKYRNIRNDCQYYERELTRFEKFQLFLNKLKFWKNCGEE